MAKGRCSICRRKLRKHSEDEAAACATALEERTAGLRARTDRYTEQTGALERAIQERQSRG
jgi:hypothetical protein